MQVAVLLPPLGVGCIVWAAAGLLVKAETLASERAYHEGTPSSKETPPSAVLAGVPGHWLLDGPAPEHPSDRPR
jgi:hypothetical protein